MAPAGNSAYRLHRILISRLVARIKVGIELVFINLLIPKGYCRGRIFHYVKEVVLAKNTELTESVS